MQYYLLNMKRTLIITLTLLFAMAAPAQRVRKSQAAVRVDTVVVVDTVFITPEEIKRLRSDDAYSDTWRTITDDSAPDLESFNANVDSLLSDWNARHILIIDGECVGKGENPSFPDTVYMQRLANMPTVVPMVYNQIVRSVIDRYATKNRALVAYMLGMMQFYGPSFEQALDYYNVPQELKYLPVIESALNPKAVSRAGATGMWQFMSYTSKQYNLRLNSLVDDRRDPYLSTWAAAKYLRDLHNLFGDWTLAIAAYNCGPGNINKAIHRAGGKTDFWDIYPFLPRETRGYVPAFIAANYIMTYYADHGICPMECGLPLTTDTLMLHQNVYLNQIAAVCDVDMETLNALNPQYKENMIPAGFESYSLRLPMEKIPVFLDREDSVYNYRRADYFPPQKTVEVNEVKAAPKSKVIVHKIRQGESLGSIAKKYHVTVSQLKKWNGLRSDKIQAGRTLKIHR